MPVHDGLKLWLEQKNAEGGVFVKAFDKKIPLKLVAYDDQSNTGTAATLYNQLITQDKVDILISDSGSVLTSVAVPIARDNKMLLIDQTGTGASFFSPDNPYIVLMSDPVSSIWPKPLADFITQDGPKLGIKKVAMIYATNDFTGTQATAVRKFIKESNSGVELVYDNGVPTETSNYTVLANNIRAAKPDAVIASGLRAQRHRLPAQSPGQRRQVQDAVLHLSRARDRAAGEECRRQGAERHLHLRPLLRDRLPGRFRHEPARLQKGVGREIRRRQGRVRLQLGRRLHHRPHPREGALGHRQHGSAGAAQGDLQPVRQAARRSTALFELDENGAQIGEITPLGQLEPEGGHIKFVTVYPHDVANGKPQYPAP